MNPLKWGPFNIHFLRRGAEHTKGEKQKSATLLAISLAEDSGG